MTVGDFAGNLTEAVKAAADMSEKLRERASNESLKPGVWLPGGCKIDKSRRHGPKNRRRSSAEARYRPGRGADSPTKIPGTVHIVDCSVQCANVW